MEIHGNSMEIPWKFRGNSVEIHGNSMEIHGNSMEIHGNSMEINGNSWKFMEILYLQLAVYG